MEPFRSHHAVTENSVAVPTHCLYPSGSAVVVFVQGSANRALVSDEGGAVGELVSHNRIIDNPDRILRRFCKKPGLHAKDGVIVSPIVSQSMLASAVIQVANASASVAHWGAENLKAKRKKDIRRELHTLLTRVFDKDRISSEGKLLGKSNRSYKFDRIVELNNDKMLIVDSVLPDPNSINSRAIAHFDVKQAGDDRIIQRVVYDDEDDWSAADLNLLQMSATLVPFSRLEPAFEKLKRGSASV